MLAQGHSEERERIIAEAISGFIKELRMVDVADYVAFLRLELYHNIADLVASAAEHFFAPDFLTFGHGGEVIADWSSPTVIVLDLIMRPTGANIYFTVKLEGDAATIDLTYISFDAGLKDPEDNTRFLKRAIGINAIPGHFDLRAMQN